VIELPNSGIMMKRERGEEEEENRERNEILI
jgi:hypothetical protein